ncbi:glycosyltransferase family 4 protein [Rhodopirellula europaea]|uniref:Glycosyl transferase group 1 n=1 Tax=Rhodopirellula europaea SH398 TaxID=1263868 RepID=M5SAR9_9BACT|nr:glycosyltransferase family 4 protein [Rhodopirellula europaea]EMI24757.1 glycosyl transferase group 1 [Rhodopirellula europaea SH398]
MRILYYSPHPTLNLSDPSGYGTHMRQMIGAFRKLGHEVFPMIAGGVEPAAPAAQAVSDRTPKNLVKKIIPRYLWETLKDIRIKKFDRYYQQQLAEKIQQWQPDLIYERATYLQTSGVTEARRHGVRHFLEVNSPYVEERVSISGKSALLAEGEKCEATQMRDTDNIIVVSSALKSHFQQRHGVGADKILVVPNAVNQDQLRVDSAVAESLRQQWSLDDKIVVGFVGAIFPWHGVDVLLRGAVDLICRNPNVRLLIVGGGLYLDGLTQLASDLAIDGSVIFTDNVPNHLVPTYISLMDVAVAPRSGWYQSPIKIFEYGGLRKPIVVHDTVPARDVMVDGVDGLLVESSEEVIAASLRKMIADPALRQRFAGTFHEKVMANYTWDRAAENVLSLCGDGTVERGSSDA